jgi:hypothetical protein
MPIRAEVKGKYPADWKLIRARILAQAKITRDRKRGQGRFFE